MVIFALWRECSSGNATRDVQIDLSRTVPNSSRVTHCHRCLPWLTATRFENRWAEVLLSYAEGIHQSG